mgnify:CR=1 FL=1
MGVHSKQELIAATAYYAAQAAGGQNPVLRTLHRIKRFFRGGKKTYALGGALFLLLAMLLAPAGCSGKSGTGRGSDWARYANRPGMLMVMDEAYLFYNP